MLKARTWRRSLFLLLLCAAVPALAAGPVTVSVVENTPDRIVVDYRIGDFGQTPVVIDGHTYVEVSLPHEPVMLEKGAPELPKVCRSVVIGPDAAMEAHIIASDYYDITGIKVAPSKGSILRTVDPAMVPYEFGPTYSANAFYPGELVSLQAPHIMRDFRGQVIDLFPFQYNPGSQTLRVYTHIRVEVVRTGVSTDNVLAPRRDRPVCAAFHQLYKHHFINYEQDTRYDPLNEQGSMLIICYDQWLPNIQPLVDHKNDIMIDTTAVGISTVGTTWNQVKTYIQNVYDTTDLAFVLLVGDAAQVPTPSPDARDPIYAKVAGGDDYPDIMIGRFSAENAAQVDLQVLKTIEYEDNEYTTSEWFWRGMGVASAQGTGDDGEYDWEHIDNIRTQLLGHGYTIVDQIYDTTGATAAMVTAGLNAGRGIINYCGHGSPTSWGTTGFSNGDVNALANYNMLPVILSVACNNGEFQDTTCFGEAWLRASRDGEPTGAVGAYMSSISQSWSEPMQAEDEFANVYCSETYVCWGTLCFAGACSMYDDYHTATGLDMLETWILFGDPSLRIVGVAYIPPLRMEAPNGVPEFIPPREPTVIQIKIEDGTETLVSESPQLHYRYDGGDYLSVPLLYAGDSIWEGTLPEPPCGATPEYYFTAVGSAGSTQQLPLPEDGGKYTAIVATVLTLINDSFESDLGWTVWNDPSLATGAWQRGIPAAAPGAPVEDFDGSGQCYLTENRAGNYDVDGGPTMLISPLFDASNGGDMVVKYARWLTCDDALPPSQDYLDLEVSNDNGATWTRIQRNVAADDWVYDSVNVAAFVPLTAQMRMRFGVADNPNNSVTEAGIDAVQILNVFCHAAGTLGDLNCDGSINAFDIDPFVLAMTDPAGYATAFPNCDINNADVNGDGQINAFDIDPFVDLLTGE